MPPVNAEFSATNTEDFTMTYATEARSHAEVEDLLERLSTYISEHQARERRLILPQGGLTYEDGVFDALRWVYGLTDEHPFPLDEEL